MDKIYNKTFQKAMGSEQTKAYEKKKEKAIPWQKQNPDTKPSKNLYKTKEGIF